MKRLTIESLGGEEGCRRLAQDFYGRVAQDSILRPRFPGKSLRCATEEFAAFLVQFLDGDSADYQYRWWVSLKESHARFKISEEQRSRWVDLMHATLDGMVEDREAWKDLFLRASYYVVGMDYAEPDSFEWRQQISLDEFISHLSQGQDDEAIAVAKEHAHRPTVFIGILARMMELGRSALQDFVIESVEQNPRMIEWRYNGRTLLHFAAGAGCMRVVRVLLDLDCAPDGDDSSGYTPLYRAANGSGDAGIVCALIEAGADVHRTCGSMRSTALHAAARRGHLAAARALLEAGASPSIRDKKGDTPGDRARNTRHFDVAALIDSY